MSKTDRLLQRFSIAKQRQTGGRKHLKPSSLLTYTAVFALIISIISIGYRSPVDQQLASQSPTRASIEVSKPSVDQLVAADMAAVMAETANLPVATNVANLSISLTAKGELAQTDDNLISKPQIVQPTAGSREIREYKAVGGDNVAKVARQFGVSEDTVRWANGLDSDGIDEGKVLRIPSVSGIIYTVKGDDTVDSLADKYQANAERITLYNDLELTGISEGGEIVIPNGILPEEERPGYEAQEETPDTGVDAPVSGGGQVSSSGGATMSSTNVGNRYDYGYCTWYVYEKRAAIGRPVGSFWGNATSWSGFAMGEGFTVNNSPAPGAVMQSSGGWGGYGHVAFVESVSENGDVTVSEMNYEGWNSISSRTLSAAQAASYNYIH